MWIHLAQDRRPLAIRLLAAGLALALASGVACVPPPVMCASSGDCPAKANCAAGRCVAAGATPAINNARRLVISTSDIGYIHEGTPPPTSSGLPTIARVGAEDGGVILLRFDLVLPPEANILEAYLLLDRLDEGNDEVLLHAGLVVEPWNGASVSWALQPKVLDIGSPVTRVPRGSGFVRLDVSKIIGRWRERRGSDFGVAVMAEGAAAASGGGASPNHQTGVTFALLPLVSSAEGRVPGVDLAQGVAHPRPAAGPAFDEEEEPAGPALELYVK